MDLRVLRIVSLWALIALAGSFLPACNQPAQQLPYYHTADLTPVWNSRQPDTLHVIAPYRFTDHHGNTITNESFSNKVYVANFFFATCRGICPKMMGNLKTVADTFAGHPEVAILSHTVTPEVDSLPMLKAYAKDHRVTKQWHLVTGNKKDIYHLARHSYFAEQEAGPAADTNQFLHSEHLVLVDKERHLRGVYNGTLPLGAVRLIEDIRILLAE